MNALQRLRKTTMDGGAALRGAHSSFTSMVAGGDEMRHRNRIAEIDTFIPLARKEMEREIRGRDLNTLSNDQRKRVGALQSAIDFALEDKADRERILAQPSSVSYEEMARMPHVADLVQKSRDAMAAYEDGARRGVGFSENRRLLRESTKADMLLGEAIAKFR